MGSSTFEADVTKDLQERWEDLTSWMTDEVRKKWWIKIVAAYSENHRKYHNIYHLHQMFQHYDQHKDNLQNRFACAYAIFFHDIVYNPKAQDNEAQSADVFKHFCKETTIDQEGFVVQLIEATATHCTEAHLDLAAVGSDDLHHFLDMDLAILGANPPDYDQYKEQIRQEYIAIDEQKYIKERLKVLKLFLQIPNIFATQVFRESYEKKARDNIQREIKSLEESLV